MTITTLAAARREAVFVTSDRSSWRVTPLPSLPDLRAAHVVPEVILFQRFEKLVEAWRDRHLRQGPEVPIVLAARHQEATPRFADPFEGGQHATLLAAVEALVK